MSSALEVDFLDDAVVAPSTGTTTGASICGSATARDRGCACTTSIPRRARSRSSSPDDLQPRRDRAKVFVARAASAQADRPPAEGMCGDAGSISGSAARPPPIGCASCGRAAASRSENVAADALPRGASKTDLERRTLPAARSLRCRPTRCADAARLSRIVPASACPRARFRSRSRRAAVGPRRRSAALVWVRWSDDAASRPRSRRSRSEEGPDRWGSIVALRRTDAPQSRACHCGAVARRRTGLLQALRSTSGDGPFDRLAYPLVLLFDRGVSSRRCTRARSAQQNPRGHGTRALSIGQR